MSVYWLCIIPFLLWFLALLFAADRLNSQRTTYIFLLSAVLCFIAGLFLFHYQVFEAKRGFFVAVFAVPLIYLGVFELLRAIYKKRWHENPCINVRSGRWLGDRPVEGFFTKYPPDKVISWSDVLFGVSQIMIFIVVVLTLFICSLAMDW